MKTYNNIFSRIFDYNNLYSAFIAARRNKRYRSDILKFSYKLEENLKNIQYDLIYKTYQPGAYRTFYVYDPKTRLIMAAPLKDRIIHHALCNVIEPIFDKTFIDTSYACRLGRGVDAGVEKAALYIKIIQRKYHGKAYCLKCDISKFYPSVNHEIMYSILQRKIKCRYTLELLKEIIESVPGECNVPIGNYLSQWLGNMYLNELDDYIKHNLHVKHYIRYCDDFVLFGKKQELVKVIPLIKDFVGGCLKMRMSKCDLFPVSRGIDFLGYRHFPNNYVLLRKTTAKRVKKRIKGLIWQVKHGKITKESAIGSIESTKGWIKWANTHNLTMALELKEVKAAIEKI